jgi:Domain of unknown function (DUF1918)
MWRCSPLDRRSTEKDATMIREHTVVESFRRVLACPEMTGTRLTGAVSFPVRRGDVVSVAGRHVGERGRFGEILEVVGDVLHPHYRVRWEDGRESILYPGEEATIHVKSRVDRGGD